MAIKHLPVHQNWFRCENQINHRWGAEGPIAVTTSSGLDGDLIVSAGQTKYTDDDRTYLMQSADATSQIVVHSNAGLNQF